MKIISEVLREAESNAHSRQDSQRVVVSLRGALRAQVRLPSRSKRVVPAFRKHWIQTISF